MRGWIIGIAALALAGCEPATDMVPVARQAVTQFHQQLDAGQVTAITGAAEAKTPASSERFGQMLDVARIRLGKVVSSTQTSIKDEYKSEGRLISMTYTTVFADGAATEDFVYHITGGKAVLYSYSLLATDTVVTEFHKRLDAGDFAAIEAMAGPEIKDSGQSLAAILAQVRDRMGAIKSTKAVSFNAREADGVRRIELTYETVFANGTEKEEFVFRLHRDGAAELAGYYVEPVKAK